jgi:hypothetical protein
MPSARGFFVAIVGKFERFRAEFGYLVVSGLNARARTHWRMRHGVSPYRSYPGVRTISDMSPIIFEGNNKLAICYSKFRSSFAAAAGILLGRPIRYNCSKMI